MAKTRFADDYPMSWGIPWRPPLTREQVKDWDQERLSRYLEVRRATEQGAIENPVSQGWTLPMWELFQQNWQKYTTHVFLGGNRSSKSSCASRACVWVAGAIPEAEIRCYHVSEERSISDQQAMVYDALPQHIKDLPTKKGRYHSLQFAQKNGFTDNICILPPVPGARKGSALRFGNYRQYQQDAQVVEGFKAHLIWGDEEMPQRMFETLLYRTVDFHGRIILSFTTLNGWTPLIQDLLGKTKTLQTRAVPDWAKPILGTTPLPIMQESLSRPGTAIYYFWSEDNAFIDTEDFISKIKSRPKEEVLARAFGIPTKAIAGAFPQFNKEVNVIPHEKLPWLPENLKKDKNGKPIPYPVTRYMAIDPAGSKPWVMLWVAVDSLDTWWVYAEWPDDEAWAEPGNTAEGKAGPAQRKGRRGYSDYIDIIKDVEKDGEVFERIIDPRAGAAEKQTDDGATTIIQDLQEFEDGHGKPIVCLPAPVSRSGSSKSEIENGIQLINNLLAWDESKPKDAMNTPRLFISDRCQNLIYAMSEYTAQGGPSEATKDFIDVLRYIAHADARHIDISKNSDYDNFGRTGSY